ncbi:MAG: prepilin peptidase [Gemmatimonadota bacterium]
MFVAVLGASVGSFLNVCIARLPAGESLIRPRSQCPSCGTPIRWYDNLPILSWLALRARCRDCRRPISIEYPAIELATLLIWLGMGLLYGPGWRSLQGSVLFSLLLTIALIDARHYLIPDVLSLGGVGAGLALSLLPGPPSLPGALAGSILGFLLLLAVGIGGELLFKKPAMGGGDMKMMALVGAFLQPVGAMLTIFLGALAGTLIFGPISLKTKKLVPFGVFLAVGAAATFLFGEAIGDWYRKLVLGAG